MIFDNNIVLVLVSKYLVPKGYLGVTLFPFVFLKSFDLKKAKTLINHENIHLKQQLELLIVPFYIVYSLEFALRYIQFKNWKKAYRNISFEREAFCNEHDKHYLKTRKFWQFLKYIRVDAI